MKSNIIIIAIIFLLDPLWLLGQGDANISKLSNNQIGGFTLGLGVQSLGFSEYNKAFKSLGVSEVPNYLFSYSLGYMKFRQDARFYFDFQVDGLTYNHTENKLGALNYSFIKQNLSVGGGYFILNNKRFMVPVQLNFGMSTLVFNSHVARDNSGRSFTDLLSNGSGEGISNYVEIDLIYRLTTGLDFKTELFKNKNNRHYSTNIGFRVGIVSSAFQLKDESAVAYKSVSGMPNANKNNFLFMLHVTRLLFTQGKQ